MLFAVAYDGRVWIKYQPFCVHACTADCLLQLKKVEHRKWPVLVLASAIVSS